MGNVVLLLEHLLFSILLVFIETKVLADNSRCLDELLSKGLLAEFREVALLIQFVEVIEVEAGGVDIYNRLH